MRKVSEKTSFLVFVGSGGYPHVKNAVLQKRPVATRAKSDDFGAIWGGIRNLFPSKIDDQINAKIDSEKIMNFN